MSHGARNRLTHARFSRWHARPEHATARLACLCHSDFPVPCLHISPSVQFRSYVHHLWYLLCPGFGIPLSIFQCCIYSVCPWAHISVVPLMVLSFHVRSLQYFTMPPHSTWNMFYHINHVLTDTDRLHMDLFHMESTWSLCGVYADSTWNPCGFHVECT